MGGFSNGVYSRNYNWTNDAGAGILIRADRMDTEDNGFATGLSTCLLKDGTQVVTANIPFAGFKLTGVGAGTVRTDAANLSNIQDGQVIWAGTATGTANAIALGTTPATTNLLTGRRLRFKALANSSGAVTVAENGQAAKKLLLPDGSTQAGNGNIIINALYDITYDAAADSAAGAYILDANGNPSVLAAQMPALTGDITTSAGAVATTLATVNSNVGSFTNANITVNAKGQVTAASNGAAAVPYALISGCLPSSIAGNHTTASMTVGSGQAVDSTNAVFITCAGYSWLASNGNAINGTDAASSTLANSTTYHMFLISGGSGTGTFASASLTPTFPTGYTTSKRRIFSFNTDGSGAPIPYTAIETEGGALLAWLATQTLDESVTNLSTSRVAITLNVPTGIKLQPICRAHANFASSSAPGSGIIFTSGDETDVAPGTLTQSDRYAYSASVPQFDIGVASGSGALGAAAMNGLGLITTNTSGQIGARATAASTSLYITTRGFKDWRRS